jgi:uncharacterized protein (DUF488 family)
MCAEANFTKCHRQLTSDALVVRKIQVIHILNLDEAIPHVLRPSATVQGTRITYPENQAKLEF